MTIDEKRQLIQEAYKLGMDIYSCYILTECTDNEIEILDNDEQFKSRLKIILKQQEKELLDKYEIATDIAIQKGNTKPIEWMLTKLNPVRWQDVKITKNTNVNKDIDKDMEYTDEEKERLKEELNKIIIT